MAIAHLIAGRPQEAYDHASKSKAENADWIVNLRYLASAYGHLEKVDEGRAAIARLLELNPQGSLAVAASWSPMRDQAGLDFYLDGLRKAGLS